MRTDTIHFERAYWYFLAVLANLDVSSRVRARSALPLLQRGGLKRPGQKIYRRRISDHRIGDSRGQLRILKQLQWNHLDLVAPTVERTSPQPSAAVQPRLKKSPVFGDAEHYVARVVRVRRENAV